MFEINPWFFYIFNNFKKQIIGLVVDSLKFPSWEINLSFV